MAERPRNVAVFGSTGSIGTSTLDVIRKSGGALRACALSGHQRVDDLLAQVREFRPRWVVVTDAAADLPPEWNSLPEGTTLLRGADALRDVAAADEIDVVVAAIVGSAGLQSTWEAAQSGKTVALANKETLVVAGPLITDLARRHNATIIPVDSEHSAVFQALQAGRREEVTRVILTASGGPFLRHSPEELGRVTVEDALAHPTWDMGPKITIDSATMMNKALEVIEARWLFDLSADQISVMVHPQSIIHSMVEFQDGSVIAQMSPPDMKLPIQYALMYPERGPAVAQRMDWSGSYDLQLEPPDLQRFPALEVGLEVARLGGTAGAVVNAANEVAVARFLSGEIKFTEIVPACRRALNSHEFNPNPTLEDLIEMDRWAREEVTRWVYT